MTLDRNRVSTRTDLDPRVETGTYHRMDDIETQTVSDFTLRNIGRRRPTSSQLIGSNALATDETTVFCIWDYELGFAPKIHDQITDANGVRWSVRMVEHKLMNTRYHLTCIRLYNPS